MIYVKYKLLTLYVAIMDLSVTPGLQAGFLEFEVWEQCKSIEVLNSNYDLDLCVLKYIAYTFAIVGNDDKP